MVNTIVLETFKLKKLELADALIFSMHANNRNIWRNLTDRFPHPYTEENARDFIKLTHKSEPTQILGIYVGTEPIGAIGLHPLEDVFSKNIELGYWIAEPYWGKGIMSKAISQMVTYGFDKFDIDRIFARPFGRNIGSIKTLEKNGFFLEATLSNTIFKDGKYEDELIYAIRKAK
jgi:RimJ/RimL family protein N-acetyltransferase